ncbi:hypothetical protein E2K80_04700 [Rhodophyticola sp. CCM32]|nr:hypothetical protein E2K80_04700 [Rhodophyticola sp. CCM32]
MKQRFYGYGTVFASEVRYGPIDRRADFLVVEESSHAFEIKSDFDSLSRLPDQISDYVCTFDFVSVVTTNRHLGSVRSIVPPKVGLNVLSKGELTQVRQPKRFARLSKVHLAMGCDKGGLLQHVPNARSSSSLRDLQIAAIKVLSATELRTVFLNGLRERYKRSSEAFLAETDGKLNREDLLLLRRVAKIAA